MVSGGTSSAVVLDIMKALEPQQTCILYLTDTSGSRRERAPPLHPSVHTAVLDSDLQSLGIFPQHFPPAAPPRGRVLQ